MYVAICQHIKLGGGRCGSPAVRGQDYCYFHASAHRTIPSVNLGSSCNPRNWGARDPNAPRRRYELPGEAAAIQIGFTRLIKGVTQGLLNVRQAKIILAALHGAVANGRQMNAVAAKDERPAKKRPASVKVAESRRELREVGGSIATSRSAVTSNHIPYNE